QLRRPVTGAGCRLPSCGGRSPAPAAAWTGHRRRYPATGPVSGAGVRRRSRLVRSPPLLDHDPGATTVVAQVVVVVGEPQQRVGVAGAPVLEAAAVEADRQPFRVAGVGPPGPVAPQRASA